MNYGQKTVLITGAAKRIGACIALEFARRNWQVIIHYNTAEADAKNLAAQITQIGGTSILLQANLAEEDQVRSLIPRAREHGQGLIHCLVNNASLFEYDTIQTMTSKSWQDHIGVNLYAPLLLSQAFAMQPDAPSDKGWGNIIHLIDQRVWNLTPHFFTYTISKYALWGATRTLAMALAPYIRVNGIGPGPTLSNAHQTAEQFKAQWKKTPLQRQVQPQEIADAIQFIINTPSLTGQMLALDNGQHMRWTSSCHDLSHLIRTEHE